MNNYVLGGLVFCNIVRITAAIAQIVTVFALVAVPSPAAAAALKPNSHWIDEELRKLSTEHDMLEDKMAVARQKADDLEVRHTEAEEAWRDCKDFGKNTDDMIELINILESANEAAETFRKSIEKDRKEAENRRHELESKRLEIEGNREKNPNNLPVDTYFQPLYDDYIRPMWTDYHDKIEIIIVDYEKYARLMSVYQNAFLNLEDKCRSHSALLQALQDVAIIVLKELAKHVLGR